MLAAVVTVGGPKLRVRETLLGQASAFLRRPQRKRLEDRTQRIEAPAARGRRDNQQGPIPEKAQPLLTEAHDNDDVLGPAARNQPKSAHIWASDPLGDGPSRDLWQVTQRSLEAQQWGEEGAGRREKLGHDPLPLHNLKERVPLLTLGPWSATSWKRQEAQPLWSGGCFHPPRVKAVLGVTQPQDRKRQVGGRPGPGDWPSTSGSHSASAGHQSRPRHTASWDFACEKPASHQGPRGSQFPVDDLLTPEETPQTPSDPAAHFRGA
ncbi:hypothetical protein MG293_002481 [Ovis ammon polii]|uniref:Uncharacterized protein n=1 Tax=Ovis ammon polii TaxID=230172 RepID=A0AAD4UIJ2_OVIAM|nr:hypothetical protein MG293_002481 [Ovis ammon polii]